jgi:hypothetical protein
MVRRLHGPLRRRRRGYTVRTWAAEEDEEEGGDMARTWAAKKKEEVTWSELATTLLTMTRKTGLSGTQATTRNMGR